MILLIRILKTFMPKFFPYLIIFQIGARLKIIKFWHRKSKKSHFAKFQKVQLNIIKVQFCLMKLLYWTITIHNFPKQFIKQWGRNQGGLESQSSLKFLVLYLYIWLKIYYSKNFYKMSPPLNKNHSALTENDTWNDGELLSVQFIFMMFF